jgi:hypothetical protein
MQYDKVRMLRIRTNTYLAKIIKMISRILIVGKSSQFYLISLERSPNVRTQVTSYAHAFMHLTFRWVSAFVIVSFSGRDGKQEEEIEH